MVLEKKCIHAIGLIQSLVDLFHQSTFQYIDLWIAYPLQFHICKLNLSDVSMQAYSTTKCAINYSCISRLIFHFSMKSLQAWKLNHDDGRMVSIFWNMCYLHTEDSKLFMCESQSIIAAQWHIIQSNFSTFWPYRVAKSTSTVSFSSVLDALLVFFLFASIKKRKKIV